MCSFPCSSLCFPWKNNHIRLEHVLSAMRTTDAPLTQLWGEAGFNSQRSFNRFFQETMGMTPTQYRQRLSR